MKNPDNRPAYDDYKVVNVNENDYKMTEMMKSEENYDPFEDREVSHPNSSVGAVIHLVKSSLGTGVLAMPFAFAHGGLIFGTVGTLIIGYLVTHCITILVESSHEICRRSKTPSLGFSETAETAFEYGPEMIRKWAKAAGIFVDIAIVLAYYSGSSVYVILIVESFSQVIDHYEKLNLAPIYYILMLLIPLILVCQIRELKYLVPFSFLANVCLIVTFSITLYYVFRYSPSTNKVEHIGNVADMPIFFSTVIFAIEGIGVVLPVENNMKHPHHFLGCPGVLNVAMFIISVIFATLGFCGYLRFAGETDALITKNLPIDDILAQVAKIAVGMSVFFTYTLLFYVPYDIAWRKWISPRLSERNLNVGQIVARTLLVAGSVAIAALIPNLRLIIPLVGAVCFSTLGIFIPVAVEQVVMWDNPGKFYWRPIKNFLLFAFYLFALGTGTYDGIKGIVAFANKIQSENSTSSA